MKVRTLVSWSGGKDSTLVLDRMLRNERYDVAALVTTVDLASQQVTAHGIPFELIERQADSIGLPVVRVTLPAAASRTAYLREYVAAIQPFLAEGVRAVAFGGTRLVYLRQQQEEAFRSAGILALFPLWEEPSRRLTEEFLARGFDAIVCCVNGAFLEQKYLTRLYDRTFVERMPPQIDGFGENGEFHAFVFDGPIFRDPVQFVVGGTTYRAAIRGSPFPGHWFCEIRATQLMPTRCPLCGEDNLCGVANGRATCWCYTERIPADVRERIPPYARGIACICPKCAVIEEL